ncbi:aminotransferase class I/II-fold pyridoxal phosphate-dependent enzyme [Syntrophomonas curvata]
MPQATPIYSALKAYAGKDFLRLHMPGHAGKGIKQQELSAFASLDVTEVPGLDDLHLPAGIIQQSQELLARAFAAGDSCFLVNGATEGIHALFLALGSEGKKILLPRNAHRSFYGGMVLSGAMPVYIPVQTEPGLGIALAVTAEDIDRLLRRNPEAEAVFFASPSYYGTTCDIAAIAAVTRTWGKNLLVDEAHGAHFSFSKLYPQPALRSGADAVVNGLHKTLPVLNQGAVLHLSASLADNSRIRKAASLLATTSPSYPVLASIELARQFMEENGESLLERAYEFSRHYRCQINHITGLKTCEQELREVTGVAQLDPLKVLVSVQGTALNGYQFASQLRDKHRIQVELEDSNVILAMFSIFHEAQDWKRFYQALEDIAYSYPGQGRKSVKVELNPLPPMLLSPRQAFMAPCRRVALKDGVNQIAGEMIAAYPPGIPCILPGELISREMIDYLAYLSRSGARIQGPEDAALNYINIIDLPS